MELKPQGFRNGSTLSSETLFSKLNPLIHIKSNGEIVYGSTKREKEEIFDSADWKNDVLLLPWVGQRSTDVFQIKEEDLGNILIN